MSMENWYKEWYKRMWEIHNSAWDQFLREYVFAKDPPFKISARPARVLGDSTKWKL